MQTAATRVRVELIVNPNGTLTINTGGITLDQQSYLVRILTEGINLILQHNEKAKQEAKKIVPAVQVPGDLPVSPDGAPSGKLLRLTT